MKVATTNDDLEFALTELRTNSRNLFLEKMELLESMGLDDDQSALQMIEMEVEQAYIAAKNAVTSAFADGVLKIKRGEMK